MADQMTITFEGKEHSLDDFELGDLEWLEEYLGTTLADEKAMGSMKAAVAFVYLIKRQDDPEFTLEQARKTKMSVFNDVTDSDGARPKRPTRAGAAKA